jgi:hypothetical protein
MTAIKLPSADDMRKRFWELKAEREKIVAKRDPAREERDALVAEQAKALEKADAKVKKAEEGLFDIDQEMAMLVRLVGATGAPGAEGGVAMGDPEGKEAEEATS